MRKFIRHWRWLALVFLVITFIMLRMFSYWTTPDGLGVADGRLAPLPDSPNCVSSQTDDSSKRVQPIPWTGTSTSAIDQLQRIIEAEPQTKIVTRTDHYLHAEYRSLLFRFIDDVEFYVNQPENQIEIRSASRVGRSDFGVNRQRVERLRTAFLRQSELDPPTNEES